MTRVLALLFLAACTAAPHAAPAAAPSQTAVAPPPVAPRTERFDELVRQDFFDGMRGDSAAFNRAMKLCEDALAANPAHAEAMVWHGAGLVFRAGEKFRSGDSATGSTLYGRGLGEMDKAVELAPDNVGVRIPRGAVLLAMAPYVPEPEKTKLVQRGVADYEATLKLQRSYFTTLTLHSREQLLYGLTDGYAMLGDKDRARELYSRMEKDAAGSELLPRAKRRADGGTVEGQTPCEGCHAR